MHDSPVQSVQFLIVDDHAFVRRFVSQHLKSCGIHRFIYAQDGVEAAGLLAAIEPRRKDPAPVKVRGAKLDIDSYLPRVGADPEPAFGYCVITDFGMPHANGLQLLKTIRCGETGIARDTPVILLTGYSDDYVVAAALRLDVNAFILKPVSRNSLWEKVQRVLSDERPLRAIAAYAAVQIIDEAGAIISAPPAPDAPVEDWQKNVRWLALETVQPGAVLASNLQSGRGTLLLRQGTILSAGILQKLLDVQGMNGVSGKIPIKMVLDVSGLVQSASA